MILELSLQLEISSSHERLADFEEGLSLADLRGEEGERVLGWRGEVSHLSEDEQMDSEKMNSHVENETENGERVVAKLGFLRSEWMD